MISVTHFAGVAEDFPQRAQVALEVLAAQRGYLRGTFGRSTDEVDEWVLVTEWDSVGSYRRALGAYQVKLNAWPLFYQAVNQPTSFESLITADPGGAAVTRVSDRAT